MTTTPVLDLIDRTVEVLIEDGWRQNGYGQMGGAARHTTPHCLLGAVLVADTDLAPEVSAVNDLVAGLERSLGDLGVPKNITVWNDADSRTVDQVVGLLRHTRDVLEGS